MDYTIKSFDGTDLNDASYASWFPYGTVLSLAPSSPKFALRHEQHPALLANNAKERYLSFEVQMKGTIHTQRDELARLFNTTTGKTELKTLIVTDASAAEWQVQGVVTVFDFETATCTVGFATPDTHWKKVTAETDSWAITTDSDTNDLVLAGNEDTNPVIKMTPTSVRGSGGQDIGRFIKVVNNAGRSLVNYPINLANSEASNGLDTQTIIAAAGMEANGYDLEIIVDGLRVNRWLNDIDTTSTEIWINLNMRPGITGTLGTAIAGAGAITEIAFANTPANRKAMQLLPNKGQVIIASEYFTYTGKNIIKRKLTGVTRSVFNSAAAAHSVGDTITWIEHQVWLTYGNTAATVDPNDPDADDYKPAFALSSSNTGWNYTEFSTLKAKRSGEWNGNVQQQRPGGRDSTPSANSTRTYTATLDTFADPSTAMGMKILSELVGGLYANTSATILWQMYNAAGITHVTVTGKKNRSSTDWPARAEMIYSNDGRSWTQKFNEDTPAVAGTPDPLDVDSVAQNLGATYQWLAFRLQGGVSGGAAAVYAWMELLTVDLTLDSTKVPTVAIAASAAAYNITATLENTTSGESIEIDAVLNLNETLIIDTQTNKVYLEDDNSGKLDAVKIVGDVRSDWLRLLGAQTNTIEYTDTGTGNITVVFEYHERNN